MLPDSNKLNRHQVTIWFPWKACIGKLIVYCTSHSKILNTYRDVAIVCEEMQKIGFWLALRAFEQEEIFSVPHLQWHGALVFPVSSERQAHLVASYYTQGYAADQL
jgi:hypothetical protein